MEELTKASEEELTFDQHKAVSEQLNMVGNLVTNEYLPFHDFVGEKLPDEKENMRTQRIEENRRVIPALDRLKVQMSRRIPAHPNRSQERVSSPRSSDGAGVSNSAPVLKDINMSKIEMWKFSGAAKDYKKFENRPTHIHNN